MNPGIQAAFAPLPEVAEPEVPAAVDGPIPIVPIPEGTPQPSFGHNRWGQPTRTWEYRDASGRLLGHTARFDTPAGKEVLPLSWCALPGGGFSWRWKGWSSPRPLYGLDRLAARPDAPVLVVEGEKTADAAAELFPDYVAVTWPGGANAVAKADWSPLRDRSIVMWPDADDDGRTAMSDAAALLRALGAVDVRLVAVPTSFPPKWDVADALPDGVAEADLWRMLDDAARQAADLPLPLFPALPPAEPYPIGALGPTLSAAASAIARKVQVPVAIAAQSVLAAASLAAQPHADVGLPYGQTRPLSLYLVTVAGSGERKTTADTEALWPIRKREQTLHEEHNRAHQAWGVAQAVWIAERKRIESDKKLTVNSRRLELEALGPEPEHPLHPFLVAPDPTVEGLVKAWVSAPASLGLFSAEGGQFIGGHGMSQDNRLKTAATLSEIWDGKTIKRIRAMDGVTILPGRRLAMHLLVQPDAAARFFGDPLLRDQGLLSRVLLAAPDSTAGTRMYREQDPLTEASIRHYGGSILSLLEARWPLAEGKQNELEPRTLGLSPEATEAWRTFYNHIEAQCGAGRELFAVQDFAGKAAEHAARIAGVLTIVENVSATEIGQQAMANAIALMDWYVNEAQRLQRTSRTDPRLRRAQQLLDWIRDRGTDEIDVRDILRLGPAQTRTKREAEEALEALVEHGWVVEVSGRPHRVRLNGETA